MLRLGTSEEARDKVLADAQRCMDRIRGISSSSFNDPDAAVELLQRIRSESYEDLNQIQHEHLIICAMDWLLEQNICPKDVEWYWNPRQTGDHSEPDLLAKRLGVIVVSAEITTSDKPNGKIDTRMRDTLAKLARQDGELFYFVRTRAMTSRAATKIRKSEWNIKVVQIDLSSGFTCQRSDL